MVILGGLEIVAAGFLLNEFNKDKIEARERRKHDKYHDRPHSRPPHDDSQSHRPSTDQLAPPLQPLRPSSAPPDNATFNPGGFQQPWHPPAPPKGSVPPSLHPSIPQQPPGSPYPFQTQLQNINRPQAQPSYQQGPPPPYGMGAHSHGPPLSNLQHAATFHHQQSPPVFQQSIQQSQTFPIAGQQQRPLPPQNVSTTSGPQQIVKPPPQGPLVYIDTKTGKAQYNMFPPDHPMARGLQDHRTESSVHLSEDRKYTRALPGDLNTGLVWSDRDENNLAYGKDYSSGRHGDRFRG